MKKFLAVLFALVLLATMVSVVAAETEKSPSATGEEIEYSMDKVTYTKGTKVDTLGTADIPFAKFAGIVLIEGKEVSADNYVAEEGSTKITFKGDYLETFDVGTYALEVKATDGKAVTTLEIKAAPSGDGSSAPTGDNSHTAIWVAVSLVSLGCIGLVAFGLKRKTATK